MNAHGLPDDLDDALFDALRELLGRKLAHAATEAVCEVLAARRDALFDMQTLPTVPLPPGPPDLAAISMNWLLGHDIGALP